MPNDTPKLCPEPGCGLEMVVTTHPSPFFVPMLVCPRNADAHELAAKLAESEAKVKVLVENRIPFAEVIVDLWEWADKVLKESEARGFSGSANLCITEETHSAYANAVGILGAAREASRKKGAEHGE